MYDSVMSNRNIVSYDSSVFLIGAVNDSSILYIHFVSNDEAAKRLLQMGEIKSSIFTIGSPDIDIMFSNNLPTKESVTEY